MVSTIVTTVTWSSKAGIIIITMINTGANVKWAYDKKAS